MDLVGGGYGLIDVAYINKGNLAFAVCKIGCSKVHVDLADVRHVITSFKVNWCNFSLFTDHCCNLF